MGKIDMQTSVSKGAPYLVVAQAVFMGLGHQP